MNEGKPKAQSLAIAYSMKRRAKKMAKEAGGEMSHQECDENCSSPCDMHAPEMQDDMGPADEAMGSMDDMAQEAPSESDDKDMISRIMSKRMSKGGMVANEDHGHDDEDLADFMPNEFDDLAMRDDLEESYTGANSGDELGNEGEDKRRSDIVARIMASRAKKDKLPNPR